MEVFFHSAEHLSRQGERSKGGFKPCAPGASPTTRDRARRGLTARVHWRGRRYAGTLTEARPTMLHIVDRLVPWLGPGQPPFAVATVVAASGSVPRPVGTAMAVRADGAVLGSLSGGCVEGAVHDAALDAIATGQSRRETFGYSDADAFAVGLSCGGTLDVHVQPVLPGDDAARALAALAATTADPGPPGAAPVALVRRSDGPARTAVVVDDPARADEATVAAALHDVVGEAATGAAAPQVVALLRTGGTATVHAAHGAPRPGT